MRETCSEHNANLNLQKEISHTYHLCNTWISVPLVNPHEITSVSTTAFKRAIMIARYSCSNRTSTRFQAHIQQSLLCSHPRPQDQTPRSILLCTFSCFSFQVGGRDCSFCTCCICYSPVETASLLLSSFAEVILIDNIDASCLDVPGYTSHSR